MRSDADQTGQRDHDVSATSDIVRPSASREHAPFNLFHGWTSDSSDKAIEGLSTSSDQGRGASAAIQVKRSIPTLALIPLLLLWFGIGEPFKVITIALAVFVPIYIHTHNGLRTIEGRYAELAETLGITRWEFIRHIVLPGAMPGFLLGMRFAVTTSLLALVVVEVINATSGIGHIITLASNYGQTDVIVVGLAVYAILGLVTDGIVRAFERRALAWRS